MINITKIYLVENCYKDPNKVYIGKEIFPQKESRKGKHRRRFGKQIEFSYIDEIQSLNQEDWKPLESFWIQYFKFLGFEVLNRNDGGGGPSLHSESSKILMRKPHKNGNKISKALKGKPKSKEHIQNLIENWNGGKEKKTIQKLSLKGELIQEYLSLSQAKKEISHGSLHRCLRGEISSFNGYIWRYK